MESLDVTSSVTASVEAIQRNAAEKADREINIVESFVLVFEKSRKNQNDSSFLLLQFGSSRKGSPMKRNWPMKREKWFSSRDLEEDQAFSTKFFQKKVTKFHRIR